jgi:hypothetical protein
MEIASTPEKGGSKDRSTQRSPLSHAIPQCAKTDFAPAKGDSVSGEQDAASFNAGAAGSLPRQRNVFHAMKRDVPAKGVDWQTRLHGIAGGNRESREGLS